MRLLPCRLGLGMQRDIETQGFVSGVAGTPAWRVFLSQRLVQAARRVGGRKKVSVEVEVSHIAAFRPFSEPADKRLCLALVGQINEACGKGCKKLDDLFRPTICAASRVTEISSRIQPSRAALELRLPDLAKAR
jgi:hypothetical protein